MVVIKVNEETLKEAKIHYEKWIKPNANEYVYFLANKEGIVITGYSSSKANKKITFSGKNELKEARIWDNNAQVNTKKEIVKGSWIDTDNQIGSDEVGVGDLLLPLVVVASYIKKEDVPLLKKLGVTDSKKLSDEEIIKIGKVAIKKFPYALYVLTNEKYNKMCEKGENINTLKAYLHNAGLALMEKEHPEYKHTFVDQFVNEKTYYKYLDNSVTKPEIIVRDITFKTKGESYYPSVALSSIIARFAFLIQKSKLEKVYKTKIPFGAGNEADRFCKKFLKTHSVEELNKLVKANFKNYQKIIEAL